MYINTASFASGDGAFGYTLSVSGGHSANQGKSNVNGVSRNKTSLHVIYKVRSLPAPIWGLDSPGLSIHSSHVLRFF